MSATAMWRQLVVHAYLTVEQNQYLAENCFCRVCEGGSGSARRE